MPWQSPFRLTLALAASLSLVACVSVSPEVKEAFAPPRPEEKSHFRLRDPGAPPLVAAVPAPGPKATPTSAATAPPPDQPVNPAATAPGPPGPSVAPSVAPPPAPPAPTAALTAPPPTPSAAPPAPPGATP